MCKLNIFSFGFSFSINVYKSVILILFLCIKVCYSCLVFNLKPDNHIWFVIMLREKFIHLHGVILCPVLTATDEGGRLSASFSQTHLLKLWTSIWPLYQHSDSSIKSTLFKNTFAIFYALLPVCYQNAATNAQESWAVTKKALSYS